MTPMEQEIRAVATAPVLLVASDFDGTLSPIVQDPAEAAPDPQSLAALRDLARLPRTHVAIISGRSLNDLTRRVGDIDGIQLVGSHGFEETAGIESTLPPATQRLLSLLTEDLEQIAEQFAGLRLERKPVSIAAHYRGMDPRAADQALKAILSGPSRREGVYLRPGKMVLELSVVDTSKGRALQQLRYQHAASAVVFIGDDHTDEEAFAQTAPPDVSIKVGDGTTLARYVVNDIADVRHLLEVLAATRDRYLEQFVGAPIERHALLSDLRATALLNPNGRIVWMCLPRIDGAAVFADLIGGPYAGHYSITDANGGKPLGQRNLGDSFILETRWKTFTVTDYLDCTGGRPFQRAGRTDLIRVIEGAGRVRVTFAPRLDFGRMATQIVVHEDGLEIEGILEPIVLRSPGIQWEIQNEGNHQYATAEIELTAEPVVLEMRYGTANLEPPWHAEHVRRDQTLHFWNEWGRALALPRVQPEQVKRSAMVLRALSHGPTGAIAAAATTSLPEHLGGIRNWDYRYCWPRDAALAAAALVRLGNNGTAMRFLDWLLGVLDNTPSPECLSPVYTVAGGRLMPEAEISGLRGYRGSVPVRLGNLAAQQVQLDVFGPITDLVALLGERGAALSTEHWRLVEMMVSAVQQRWQEADHGIWEVRSAKRHHVHSKVMCWLTVQRGMAAARYLGRKRPHWSELRDAIAADVLEKGFNRELNAFTATYDDGLADAAALWVGLSGLLPPDDPRFVGTVDFVEKNLRDGPTVYRYRYDDGLPGIEGGFNLCTTWLIESYILVGRRKDAEDLFEQYVTCAGPTGLFAEEYDPADRVALGNFPQAYSHLGLINAALRLAECGK